MFDLKTELIKIVRGDVEDTSSALDTYSHDASLLEVRPKIVVFPKDAQDVKAVVKFVSENKKHDATLSVTVRAAGTCMSGGPLNESIILDVTRYMKGIVAINQFEATVLPGTMYRDFEVETLKYDAILPCYTASKNLNALGGMVGNNSAGEKTLKYGKMEDYVKELKVVFKDGNEYTVKPLTRNELDIKLAQRNVEGEVYRSLFDLIKKNEELIKKSKPTVSKNSAGYTIWNVWNGETFDLTKLFVGSQGTLGIVTEMKVALVPLQKYSKLFVVFMPDISRVGELVRDILPFHPESVESYDDSTMKLALKFLPEMIKIMKVSNIFKLAWSFLPEVWMTLAGGMPKLILLVECGGKTEKEIEDTMHQMQAKIARFGFKTRIARREIDSEKYWTIRRESFNLLRKHVQGRRTAPFIDDVIVDPQYMPEFLPKMRAILDEYKLIYTIAGHAGNGNFHIIPLMDMKDETSVTTIKEVSEKVYDLVLSYGGSITAEHNDGIIRTPFLEQMYGKDMYAVFKEIKEVCDPRNIFNPGKKVGGSMEFMLSHIRKA